MVRWESGWTGHSPRGDGPGEAPTTLLSFFTFVVLNFWFWIGVVWHLAGLKEKLAFAALVLLLLPCVLYYFLLVLLLLGHVYLYSQAETEKHTLVVTSEESCIYCNIALHLDMVNHSELFISQVPSSLPALQHFNHCSKAARNKEVETRHVRTKHLNKVQRFFSVSKPLTEL